MNATDIDYSKIIDIIAKVTACDHVAPRDIYDIESMGIGLTGKMVELGWGEDSSAVIDSADRGKIRGVMFPSVVAAAVRDHM